MQNIDAILLVISNYKISVVVGLFLTSTLYKVGVNGYEAFNDY